MDGCTQEDEWEQCKENVQPLKGGRRINDLRKVLSSEENGYIKSTIQDFETQLRVVEGDINQLDVWYSYITWMEQNSKQTKDVVPLMQRFIIFFKKKNTVNQNAKYVEIWVKLSEAVDDPNLIFEYMFDHDIGTSLALFYISWAEHFEFIGAKKKSDELYNLGINRNAQPLDVLKESKRMFEMRMTKSSSNDNVSLDQSRGVLTTLKAHKNGKVPSNRVKNEVKRQVPSQKVTCGASSFAIFDDQLVTESVLPVSSKRQFKQLPIDPSLHLENTKPVTTLKGTKMLKTGSLNSSTKFSIYQEEEEEVKNSTSLAKHQVILEERKPLSAIKASKDIGFEPDSCKDIPDPKVVNKYCKNLVYMGNKEFSFEELKAMSLNRSELNTSTGLRVKLDFSKQQVFNTMKNVSGIFLENSLNCPTSAENDSKLSNINNLLSPKALPLEVESCIEKISNKNEITPLAVSKFDACSYFDITENIVLKPLEGNKKELVGHVVDALEMTMSFPPTLYGETQNTKRKSLFEVVPDSKKSKSDLSDGFPSEFQKEKKDSSSKTEEHLFPIVSSKKVSNIDSLSNSISQGVTRVHISESRTLQNALLNDSFDLDKLSNTFYEDKEMKTPLIQTKVKGGYFEENPTFCNENKMKPKLVFSKTYESVKTNQELNLNEKGNLTSEFADLLNDDKLMSCKSDIQQLKLLNSSPGDYFMNEDLFAKTPMRKTPVQKKTTFNLPLAPIWAPSPSITLNTKYAKDSIQSMFNESLDFDKETESLNETTKQLYNEKGATQKSFFLHDSKDASFWNSKETIIPAKQKYSNPPFEIFTASVQSKVSSKPFEIFTEPIQSNVAPKKESEVNIEQAIQPKIPSKPESITTGHLKSFSKPGFEIYTEVPQLKELSKPETYEVPAQLKIPSKSAFDIYTEAPVQSKVLSKQTFEIYTEAPVPAKVSSNSAFEIYTDAPMQPKVLPKPAFEIYTEAPISSKVLSKPAFEIYNEASVPSKFSSKPLFEIFADSPVHSNVSYKPKFETCTGSTQLNFNQVLEVSTQSKDISLLKKNKDSLPLTNSNSAFKPFFDLNEEKNPAFKIYNDVISSGKIVPSESEVLNEQNKSSVEISNGLEKHANSNDAADIFKKPLPLDEKICSFEIYDDHDKTERTALVKADFSHSKSKTYNLSESNSFKEPFDLSTADDNTMQMKPLLKRITSTPGNGKRNEFLTFNCSNLPYDVHTENSPFIYMKNDNKAELSIISEGSKEDCSDHSGSKSSTSSEGSEATDQYMVVFKKDSLAVFMKFAVGCITQLKNFLNINGKLPKLQGPEVELNLGPRKICIRKYLKKSRDTASYKGVNAFSKIISLKISTGDSSSLLWDFYISSSIHERINSSKSADLTTNQNFIEHYFGLKYSDAICIESPFYSEGTLRDLLDLYRRHNQSIDEVLVMLYTFEILRILETLHQSNIIHTDICLKNFLIGDCNIRDGVGPLDLRCLTLRGFYESIDLDLLTDGVMFVGSRGNEEYECPEMFEGRPWKFQVDYYAAASTIHYLIFENNMNTYVDPNTKQLTICNTFKTGWDAKIWTELFSALINFSHETTFLPELISNFADKLSQRCDELKKALIRKNDLIMEDE